MSYVFDEKTNRYYKVSAGQLPQFRPDDSKSIVTPTTQTPKLTSTKTTGAENALDLIRKRELGSLDLYKYQRSCAYEIAERLEYLREVNRWSPDTSRSSHYRGQIMVFKHEGVNCVVKGDSQGLSIIKEAKQHHIDSPSMISCMDAQMHDDSLCIEACSNGNSLGCYNATPEIFSAQIKLSNLKLKVLGHGSTKIGMKSFRSMAFNKKISITAVGGERCVLFYKDHNYAKWNSVINCKPGVFDLKWSAVLENSLAAACGDGSIRLFDIREQNRNNRLSFPPPARHLQAKGAATALKEWNDILVAMYSSSGLIQTFDYRFLDRPISSKKSVVYDTPQLYRFDCSPNSNIPLLLCGGRSDGILTAIQIYPVLDILSRTKHKMKGFVCDIAFKPDELSEFYTLESGLIVHHRI